MTEVKLNHVVYTDFGSLTGFGKRLAKWIEDQGLTEDECTFGDCCIEFKDPKVASFFKLSFQDPPRRLRATMRIKTR